MLQARRGVLLEVSLRTRRCLLWRLGDALRALRRHRQLHKTPICRSVQR